MQVADVMHTDVKTADAEETFADVAKTMRTNGISSVVVLDGKKLAGIVTERDIVNLVAAGGDPHTVKVAHGLCFSAFTTTRASTASRMTMIRSTPIIATVPASSPNSARIISPIERPSRRVEAQSTMKSCTAPAKTTPTISQSVPGR